MLIVTVTYYFHDENPYESTETKTYVFADKKTFDAVIARFKEAAKTWPDNYIVDGLIWFGSPDSIHITVNYEDKPVTSSPDDVIPAKGFRTDVDDD